MNSNGLKINNILKKYIKVLVALVLSGTIIGCGPSNPKNPDFKLKRYREIGKLESLIANSVTIVDQIINPSVSEIFKAKFKKDLIRLEKRIKSKYENLLSTQKKIATRFNEKNLNLYQGKMQNFNSKVQLGLSVESTLYKSSYLNNLIGSHINVTGRVLNTESVFATGRLKIRVPFEEGVVKTRKILVIYINAETKSLAAIQSLRRYQDIEMTLDVTNADIRESESFVVVELSGTVVEDPQIIGWLGLRVWNAEPALLPAPQKFGALNDRKLAAQAARIMAFQRAKALKNKSEVNVAKEPRKKAADVKKNIKTNVKSTKKDDWKEEDDDDEPDDF